MKEVSVSISDLVLLRNLQSFAGIGVGLLFANRLSSTQRKAVGSALVLSAFAVGIPFAVGFIGKLRRQIQVERGELRQARERRAAMAEQPA